MAAPVIPTYVGFPHLKYPEPRYEVRYPFPQPLAVPRRRVGPVPPRLFNSTGIKSFPVPLAQLRISCRCKEKPHVDRSPPSSPPLTYSSTTACVTLNIFLFYLCQLHIYSSLNFVLARYCCHNSQSLKFWKQNPATRLHRDLRKRSHIRTFTT